MIEENEEEKSISLIDSIKQRIKYLEKNDPNHATLEILKQRISDNVSCEIQ